MTVKIFEGGLIPAEPVAIGIDQSLTGFALSAVNIAHPEHHKTWVFKSEHKGVKRLHHIQNWLVGKFEELELAGNNIVEVAMEGTVLASNSALVLGELSAAVKLACWSYFTFHKEPHLVTPLQIPPMTLKKYATGKGTSKKQEMLMQIYKRWGIEFNDDNAADAYALARMASGNAIDSIEKSIVEQIKDPKYRDSLT